MTDRRLQGQEKYLSGVSLTKRKYSRYREDWEHDHCGFCGAKFSENPDDLTVGYTTADCYYWVCEECYQDFKDMFLWTIRENGCTDDRESG